MTVSNQTFHNQTNKALFNNVSTFKNLSCMTLRAIDVFDKVSNCSKPWNTCTSKPFKSTINIASKVKTDKWPDLYSFPPQIDYYVRINHNCLFSQWWYSIIDILNDSDRINLKPFVLLPIYWSIWTSSLQNWHQSSTVFLNRASTMLNNVFQS